MRHRKTITALVLIAAIILTVIALFLINRRYQTVIVSIPKFDVHPTTTSTPSVEPATTTPASINPQPSSSVGASAKAETLNLPVPFTPQAPTGNWDQLHNEACEEATALMANAYYSGVKDVNLSPTYAEGQISKLVAWEDANLGYDLDTTSAETAQMITQVYGLQTKLQNDFTADDIKKELSQNHLLIISEYGRALGNPNYKQPGPIHHMLLIKGYDGNNLITNDSGTKHGLNYIYSFDTIYSAAGDWSHVTNNVDQSKKIMIVVWK